MLKNKYVIFFIKLMILLSILLLLSSFLIMSSYELPYFSKIIKNKVEKQIHTDYQTGVVDSFFGSYKEFILHNNTPLLLKKLYKGLDAESIEKLDIALNSILHIPDEKNLKYFYIKSSKFNRDFPYKLNTFHSDKSFNQELRYIKQKYKLPKSAHYIYGVFYDEHNLRFSSEKLKKYVENKIFIDCGAYVGDSVLVLLKYNPSIIYSFEMSNMNIERFHETMKMNNVDMSKVQLVELAISDSIGTHKIYGQWEMEGIVSVNDVVGGYTVKSTDLDSFLKDKKGKTGFIKADVQGIMHKAVNGMKETIKRDRPVLNLDITGSPQDFFYTKPILEDILKDLNYTIKITSFNSAHCIIGTTIWAYPKELDE